MLLHEQLLSAVNIAPSQRGAARKERSDGASSSDDFSRHLASLIAVAPSQASRLVASLLFATLTDFPLSLYRFAALLILSASAVTFILGDPAPKEE